jgi:hypothetical protein
VIDSNIQSESVVADCSANADVAASKPSLRKRVPSKRRRSSTTQGQTRGSNIDTLDRSVTLQPGEGLESKPSNLDRSSSGAVVPKLASAKRAASKRMRQLAAQAQLQTDDCMASDFVLGDDLRSRSVKQTARRPLRRKSHSRSQDDALAAEEHLLSSSEALSSCSLGSASEVSSNAGNSAIVGNLSMSPWVLGAEDSQRAANPPLHDHEAPACL